uniref:Aquaporin-like protein n=1 Tax=Heterorhabditis bacteriophora TaxID=37862 RepID=A0A1I7WW18_HETBA
MGQISGGHFNPAVTLSQFTIRRLDAISAISYMMVQIFGAFLGAIVFRGVVSNSLYEDYFVGSHLIKDNSEDRVTRFQAFLIDALLTAFICSVYAQANLDDECSRLTIPCTWAVITFISYPLMGQCANFAIALANSVVFHLFTGDGSHTIFVYLNGFAAVLGVLFTFLLWWYAKKTRVAY